MQIAKKLKSCSQLSVLALLLAACGSATPNAVLSGLSSATANQAGLATISIKQGNGVTDQRLKTETDTGKIIGPATDCDGDGVNDDARFDFNNDGAADECVVGGQEEPIPEPPFIQTYTPSTDTFYGSLPAVGWSASYQCGEGLYDVSLARPSENQLRYSADGLTLTTPIVYDDIDPNLNQPLLIQDPVEGIRYTFTQEQGGEFYEYAIADYNGSVGLYVYQTGEQVVAAPCETTTAFAN